MPAYQITPVQAQELLDSQKRAWNRVESVQKKEKTLKDAAVQAGEVAFGALAFGLLRGRGQGEFRGVPLDLCLGVALHAAGIAFSSRKSSVHLHNIGDGAMATFFSTLGATLGARTKQATTTAGDYEMPLMLGVGNPTPTRGPLSDRELLSLIQSTAPRPIPANP